MAVIWAHGDFVVHAACGTAAIFFFQRDADDGEHVGAAGEVLGFVEGAVGLATDLAQVQEVGSRREFAQHGGEIVVGAGAEGTGAEGESVGRGVAGGKDVAKVVGGGDDARESVERKGRVVRMDGEADSEFFGRGCDFAEEFREVSAKVGGGHAVVLGDGFAHGFAVVGGLGSGEPGDEGTFEAVLYFGGHLLEAGAGGGESFGRVFGFGSAALQNEKIVGGEVESVEADG